MNRQDQLFYGITLFVIGCTGFASVVIAYKHGLIQPIHNLFTILP